MPIPPKNLLPGEPNPNYPKPAREYDIPKFLVDRVARGIGTLQAMMLPNAPMNQPTPGVFGGAAPPANIPGLTGTPGQPGVDSGGWFGPSAPMVALAPKDQVAGRAWDYPQGYNLRLMPRQEEGLSFNQLRALAESLDLVTLCIETRLDQLENLQGGVLPRKAGPDDLRGSADDRCRQVDEFMQSPDRKHTFNQWRRMIANEMLVIDAPAVYVRRTFGGDVYSLDIIDGSLIEPKLGLDGRVPDPPAAGYQQILKGLPAVDYTTDELVYMPRNPRANKVYGCSPVQQIAMTVNIGIRREVAKLNYYTDGNIPDAMMPVNPNWNPEQISQFQKSWNALMEDVRDRAGKIKFIPGGGGQVQYTRNDTLLFGQPDEWFARVICYAFSLPSLPFVQQQNRATAETAKEAAQEEGLQPLMSWFKAFMDRIIQKVFGYADLEWVWSDDDLDPAEVCDIYLPLQEKGIVSGDYIRGKLGLAPIGLKEMVMGVGPMGFMFVEDMIKTQQMGLTMPQPPPPPGMVPGAPGLPGAPVPGDPSQMGASPPSPRGGAPAPKNRAFGAAGIPQGSYPGLDPGAAADQFDPLEGVPPQLLAAVGLGAKRPAGKAAHVDPVALGVLHQFEKGKLAKMGPRRSTRH